MLKMAVLKLVLIYSVVMRPGIVSGDVARQLQEVGINEIYTRTPRLKSKMLIDYVVQQAEPKTDNCVLSVTDASVSYFTHMILYNRFNMVHFRLNFQGLDVSGTKYVIGKDHWVWTYKGGDGGYPYLYLPNDYGYLSFGILLTHTSMDEFYLNLTFSGNCSGLTVGIRQTDQLIGNALGNLTSGIASRDDRYNSSYWCYTLRRWIESDMLYFACKNSICTIQTFAYRCCRYDIDFVSRKRVVICSDSDFLFGKIWWMFPIVVGEIFFAYYPLLLAKIGSIMRQRRKNRCPNYNFKPKRDDEESTNESSDARPKVTGHFIRVNYEPPISFVSTICSPLLHINMNGVITKRILRTVIIFLPMSLSAIRVSLDLAYGQNLVKEAVRKGGLVGFSSMLAGYQLSKQEFLYLFGGPYIAISIYVIFGCICLSVPSDLETMLKSGLFLPTGPSSFLLSMSIESRQKWSRVYFQNVQGYKKIHRYLKAQLCMLLNMKFWKYVLRLFISRWCHVIYQYLLRRVKARIPVSILMCVLLPLYIPFCLIELIISFMYFAIPVVSFFFLLYKAFALTYFQNFYQSSKIGQLVKAVIFLPLSVCFCITWYMYCIIFFDGFWFLSKIAMFSYSGIIAYPKLSYGYLILLFMALYYLAESGNNFGKSYKTLLEVTIEACQRIERRREDEEGKSQILHKRGVPLEMFRYIVERHLPVRNQLVITLFKFISIVTILCISIKLLQTFDKLEDLSLVSHVFTVLFICALPKIIRVVFLNRHEYRLRKKLLRHVERSVQCLLRHDVASDSDEHDGVLPEAHGYQRLEYL